MCEAGVGAELGRVGQDQKERHHDQQEDVLDPVELDLVEALRAGLGLSLERRICPRA